MTPAAADGDPGRGPRGPLALALLAAAFAAGLVLFLALGVWQLQRMAWKHDLVARVESRIHAPAAPAPDAAAWEAAAPRDHEYRRVAVRGRWLAGHDTLVQAVTEIGPGRWLLRPLQRDGGGIVLVNLGFVPEGFQAPPPAPGPAEATGLLRLDEPGGGFLRRNDPAAGRWYSRDVAAIARHRGLDGVAPWFLDADRDSAARVAARAPWPRGGLTVVRFRDNHLGYALTWFALALLVAGGAWRFALEERRARRRFHATREHSDAAARSDPPRD